MEKQRVLESLYGAVRSTTNQFKVFKLGDVMQVTHERKEEPTPMLKPT